MECEKCGFNHESNETCEQVANRMQLLMKALDICKSGYGGILPNGQIVDRRSEVSAIPIQENSMFGTPKPKKIKN